MREFVIEISEHAKTTNPDFIIIPQNGHELVTRFGNVESGFAEEYISAIDGAGQEDLFYGYVFDNRATPDNETAYLVELLNIYELNGIEVLVTDYCTSDEFVQNSYEKNNLLGYISYAAPDRELDEIPGSPAPWNENDDSIFSLSDAKNFIYLINPENYSTPTQFARELEATNFDIVIADLFLDDSILNSRHLQIMKRKQNGGTRLALAYMSIGEAENYRYYWKDEWNDNTPSWIKDENFSWSGNYKVEYWRSVWQDIIYKGPDNYLDKIIEAGFDGVYLDIIDAFEYFE